MHIKGKNSRECERRMCRFKSPEQAQRFLSIHSTVTSTSGLGITGSPLQRGTTATFPSVEHGRAALCARDLIAPAHHVQGKLG